MIELGENLIEIAVISICIIFSVNRLIRRQDRNSMLLTLFYASMLLGNLYWTLYLSFYHKTPYVFYVSEISWCAAYLFLILLLWDIQTDDERGIRHPILWVIPVFVFGMMIFYFYWGDYLLNVIEAVLMGLIMTRSVQGLIALRGSSDERRNFYIAVLCFCLIEYAMWTVSCFWMGDTIRNPYFWIGLLQVGVLPFFCIFGKRTGNG